MEEITYPTNGAAFMIRDTAFRCLMTTEAYSLYECNTCAATVSDPERHLRYNH